MTVGELMAKLAALPPSTVVVTDDNESWPSEADAYIYKAQVERRDGWVDVWPDNGRDAVETVVLITMFGHDDKELL